MPIPRQLTPLPATDERPPISRRYLRQTRDEGVIHYLTPQGFTIILQAALLSSDDGVVISPQNSEYTRGAVELIADSVRFLHSEDDYNESDELRDHIIPRLMDEALAILSKVC